MKIFSCTPVPTVCPLRVWTTFSFEVEALVAGSKDDEKKLIGPRLVRRLGGVPGALARRELHCTARPREIRRVQVNPGVP